jgi:phosphoserine phosphatase
VFDLDGVIARTDTMAHLLQQQLLSSPLRAIAGALPAAAWFALRGYPSARVRLSRALGRAALSGLTADEYQRLAVEVGARLASDPASSIPEGLATVRRSLASGAEVVVTTGTEATLSRTFLDALGLHEVGLIATTLRFGRVLVRYDNHNLGHNKVRGFVDRTIDTFYTDSNLDLPVAQLSRHTVLVNPSRRLARLFGAKVENLTIVNWD